MVFQVNYFSPFCGWWRMGIYKHTVHDGIAGQGVITTLYTGMSFDVIYQTSDAVFHHQMKHREES